MFSSGQTETGEIVLSGGILNVFSGGTIIDTVDSGTVNVFGGTASGTTVSSGGTVSVGFSKWRR